VYRVSIGLAGDITLIEKLRGAEIGPFENDAPVGFLRGDFLRPMRNFSENRILETMPIRRSRRRDLLTIKTLEGRKLREPSKLGDNSDKLHPVTAGRARREVSHADVRLAWPRNVAVLGKTN
jgi:hypothetical protein